MNTIGASELAVALGYQRRKGDGEPYLSERELWSRLTGRLDRYDTESSPDAEVGRMCEIAVGHEWAKRNGLRAGYDFIAGPPLDTAPYRHHGLDWLHAHPDLHRMSDGPMGASPVELKAPRDLDPDRWGEDGTDQFPIEYLIQVIAQVAVMRAPYGSLAAMARSPQTDRVFAEYRWDLDEKLRDTVLHRGEEWYRKHVVGDVAPAPDGSASARWSLDREWKGRDATVWATPEVEETVHRLLQVEEAAHERETRGVELKQHVMAAMKEATVLRGGRAGEILATWREDKNGRRVFRLRRGKAWDRS